MQQHEQTKQFFRFAADDWQRKSENAANAFSVIDGRSRAILSVIDETENARRFLDVGCGTGQLVIAAAKRGLEAEGLDFAAEMIQQCEANRAEAGVNARFIEASFFDANLPDESYDIISAQGFIEYVSPDDMMVFFKRCFELLRRAGALVVGSRNRLFNAVSMNAYTELEAVLGTLDILVSESIALHSSTSQVAALEALREHERIDPHPERHPVTGIPVDTRYQYTPADLIGRLRGYGFSPATIFPVHFHGVQGAIKEAHPDLHSQLANAVGDITLKDQRVTPFCSTFVLHVTK